MNVWLIAFKEIKLLRDIRISVMLILTPIIITIILGAVLNNVFNTTINVGDIRVLYKINSSDYELTNSWNEFTDQSAQKGMMLDQANDDSDGKIEVANNRYVGYVEISDEGINYYGSISNPVESSIAQGMITNFADSYRLASVSAPLEISEQQYMLSEYKSSDIVFETTLDVGRQLRAIDYYAIAMVTLIIMYTSLTAVDLISSERKRHTANRLLASPITKFEIFAGKIVGNLLLNTICTILVVLICKYMFNVYWGEHLGLIILVLFTQIVFALSLGIGLNYLTNDKTAGVLIMIIIQVGAFIGGSYFPVIWLTGVMRTITLFSPLEWTNTAILQIINVDGWYTVVKAILLNLGLSVLLLSTAIIIMRRREGL